ncbi:hypothetical protein ACF3N7_05385 [Cruoricaptor ignavus]|uniref:hypothetical protein n=1 Tax=Cruoricaptor ignavus TaxID=1118202 RepID=UPI00370DBF52
MKKNLETKELELLNGKNGIQLETKLFGRKKVWKATFFPLGLMDVQSELYHKMQVDYDGENISAVMAKNVKRNAALCAEIIAVTVLARPWKIRLFRKILKRHFLWQVDSAKLLAFVNQLFAANNYRDFMNSIGLLSVNTVTRPAENAAEADPVEE